VKIVTCGQPLFPFKFDDIRGTGEMKLLSEFKPKMRFERDGNCISIFEGDKYISTVCCERVASGIQFYCGACSWSALERGEEFTFSECVHVQMVKEYLESLATTRSHTRNRVWRALKRLFRITDRGIEDIAENARGK
jgi:hypothetical protein